MFKSTEISIS